MGEAARLRWAARGGLIEHPVILIALAVWALNDHLWKAAYPGWLTGKLSDVACLIVIPAMVATGIELFTGNSKYAYRGVVAGAIIAAAVMVLINTVPFAATVYEWGMGVLRWPMDAAWALLQGEPTSGLRPVQLWMDPTDSFTAPAVLVPIWAQRRRMQSHAPSSGDRCDTAKKKATVSP